MNFFSLGLRWQRGLALALLLLALLSTPVLALEEVHVVQPGDTLAGIARRFDVSITQLAAYNGIDDIDFVYVGQQVLVPTAKVTVEAPNDTHTVTLFESLAGIAAAYDTTLQQLLVINGLSENSDIWVGQELFVPPAPLVPQPVSHRVQFGETLSSIARAYGLSWQYLAIYNGLKDASSIEYGQELTIPRVNTAGTLTAPPLTTQPAPELVVAPPPIPSPQTYVMRLGESMHTVALKFDVPLADLLEVNGLDLNTPVWAGQNLRLPLPTDAMEPAMPYVAPVVAPASIPSIPVSLAAESVIEPVTLPPTVQLQGLQPLPPTSFLHVVKSGESLSFIAEKYGTKASRLANFNSLSSLNVVKTGQHLQIPVALATESDFLGKRWVEIDLSQQTLTAWDGGELFLQTRISSGLANTPTPVGLFRVWHMNPSQTMSGPGYSLDNVKFNMYFFSGYAMHGAYWHNNFGNPMSHGCVNMREQDAEVLYSFASLGMEVLVHL